MPAAELEEIRVTVPGAAAELCDCRHQVPQRALQGALGCIAQGEPGSSSSESLHLLHRTWWGSFISQLPIVGTYVSVFNGNFVVFFKFRFESYTKTFKCDGKECENEGHC